MRSADVIVIGGGVAGLSVARLLAERKARVLLLEQAQRVATAASGNNAAIFRPFEETAASARAPRRTRELLLRWFGSRLIDPTGLVLASRERALVEKLAAEARRGDVAHCVLERRALWELAPSLADGEAHYALHLPDGGVLDVPALTAGLAEQACGFGAELRTEASVRTLLQRSGRVEGVALADGSRLMAASVIVATGAWTGELGERCSLALPLLPLRRHLLQLTTPAALPELEPVVWRLEDEIYYRRRGGSVLASPCDETLVAPGEQEVHPSAPPTLQNKLARLAPALASGAIDRIWACLRTFARDRELVVGADPRAQGLFWFTGLGGRGMSVAPAAAECLAARVLGDDSLALDPAWTPARLIDASKFG